MTTQAQAAIYNSLQRLQLVHQLRIASNVPIQAAIDAAKPIAYDLLSEIKTSLVGPGKGRVYTRHNPYRVHIASAPGDPPATDLGRLTNSYSVLDIKHVKLPGGSGRVEISVGSHVKYAVYLEFGTRHMLPRPHVRPAGARTALKVPAILRAAALAQQAQLKATGGTT